MKTTVLKMVFYFVSLSSPFVSAASPELTPLQIEIEECELHNPDDPCLKNILLHLAGSKSTKPLQLLRGIYSWKSFNLRVSHEGKNLAWGSTHYVCKKNICTAEGGRQVKILTRTSFKYINRRDRDWNNSVWQLR